MTGSMYATRRLRRDYARKRSALGAIYESQISRMSRTIFRLGLVVEINLLVLPNFRGPL